MCLPDEPSIIRLAQSGCRTSFSKLIDAYYDLIFSFALKYCGNRSDAEDITHQTCIRLASSLHQFRFESAFTSWLYRIVINCAHDWHRANRPLHTDLSSASDGEESYEQGGADSAVMLSQTLHRIDQMGEGFRETVVLVVAEGLSHAEAAVILDIKESTVSWRIHQVRKRLKAEQQSGEPSL